MTRVTAERRAELLRQGNLRAHEFADLLADLADAQKSRHLLSVELVVVRNELAAARAAITRLTAEREQAWTIARDAVDLAGKLGRLLSRITGSSVR